MNLIKTVSLLLIVGLCSYALLLYLTPISAESEEMHNQESMSLSASSSAQTRLFFSPSYLSLKQSQVTQVPIVIQTGENAIHQAQVEIKYNPAIVRIMSLTPGDFITSPAILLNDIDRERGRINFAISSADSKSQIKGNGTLAVLTLEYTAASGSAKTQLQFLPKTAVSGSEQQASLLQSTENLIIEPIHSL